MCIKFYQNRLGFVEDIKKIFWSVFSVHSVVMHDSYESWKVLENKVSHEK